MLTDSLKVEGSLTNEGRAPTAFTDPLRTITGALRARAPFRSLKTLWFNTGTLCNITCANCYIDSSPTNDALVYIRAAELAPFLDEAAAMGATDIGFTGGEPFMNPDMIEMAGDALGRGFSILILTNAMRPAMRPRVLEGLGALNAVHRDRLALRVSLDHYTAAQHDAERGAGAFAIAVAGMRRLAAQGLALSVAGRSVEQESECEARAGYAALFAREGLAINANDPAALVLFPEMDEAAETPEISEACWSVLGKSPADVMCADARMVVKRKGAAVPRVLACTLIAYDDRFDMGANLAEAAGDVVLNHPHCSRFCVLGGASCSGG